MATNDGYSVIIERPYPHELAVETISSDTFDALCKQSNKTPEEVKK